MIVNVKVDKEKDDRICVEASVGEFELVPVIYRSFDKEGVMEYIGGLYPYFGKEVKSFKIEVEFNGS